MNPRREPIFNVPAIIVALALALIGVEVALSLLPEQTADLLTIDFGFVPAREIGLVAPGILARIAQAPQQLPDEAGLARHALALYLQAQGPRPWTFLTYAALHAGYLHLLLNLLMLLAMGTPVARRVGAARFLALFAVGAVAGALMHLAVNPHEVVPLVGASAAVSACMGAAARFVFEPEARAGGPAASLGASLRNRAVVTFVLGWFFANALSGLGANPGVLANASIAWEAHIGGFLVGLLGFALFDRRHARPIGE